MSSRASFVSNFSELSADSAEGLAEMKEKLVNFYKVYDPSKLEDEVKVNELLLWARKHSPRALMVLIQRKYGVSIDEVDSSEKGWIDIRADILKFYRKHDRSKPLEEVEKIFHWTKQNGLAKLNERLVSKYGVPLHSVRNHGGGLQNFKERYKHILMAQDAGNLSDEVKAFYAQFEPTKNPAEIERVVQYGIQNGREAVNKSLFAKYGKTLDDASLVDGATSEERKYNLRTRLEKFYERHDPKQLTEEKLQAMCEWGAVNYVELNKHLLVTYGFDLDSKEIDPEDLRVQLFNYFSQLSAAKSRPKLEKGELEDLISFAVANGLEALNQKLLLKYGAPLPDESEDGQQWLLAEQAPKMSRLSVKSFRKSISNAIRRSVGKA